jgi:hypothetical protein
MDYIELLKTGADDTWTGKLFKDLCLNVVSYLEHRGWLDHDEAQVAVETLEDLVNVSPDAKAQRDRIIAKAERKDKDHNKKALWGIRKAVLAKVWAGRYAEHRQIYYQVSKWVLILESQCLLVSTTPIKQTEPLRTILELKRDRRTNQEIADELNAKGWRQDGGKPWTPKAVFGLITKFGDPKKRIGLAEWKDAWLSKIRVSPVESLAQDLPMIPVYRGKGDQKRKRSKVFNYPILESFIVEVLKTAKGVLTLGEIAETVELCLSPPLYSSDKETAWPESGFFPKEEKDRVRFVGRDYLACAAESFEEDVLTQDVEQKLEPLLSDEERKVFHGLQEGKSKRELAIICGRAPGTIEKVRLSLEAKAVRLDPVVRARAEQIRAQEGGKASKRQP